MAFAGDSIFWVEVDKIVANPFQPRREFDEEKLKELSESVRMYGILQPLTVTRKEVSREDGTFFTEYELIAGERRLRASKLAGLKQVPVIIREGEQTEQEKLELAIIENLQREDLNAVDRALAFRQLADVFGLSHAQVAKKVGRSREYVSNSIRLLALPDYMLSSLKQGDISEGHARTLLMLNDRPEEQDTIYREILLKKLSVREVERITRKIAQDKVRSKKWKDTDPELIEIEKQFTETLGTRVQISKTDYGGKLTIDYFSVEELDELLELMRHKGEAALSAVAAGAVGIVHDELQAIAQNTPLEVAEEPPEPVSAEESRQSVDIAPEPVEPTVAELVYTKDVMATAPSPSPEVVPQETTPARPASSLSSLLDRVVGEALGAKQEDQAPPTPPPPTTPEPPVPPRPAPESVSENASNTSEQKPAAHLKEEDETDLYSIRNFGI